MPISRHHTGQWYYQFDRYINGQRVRANKLLPQGWSRSQADAFDRRESARLYDIATGGAKPEPMIEDAVLLYLQQHAPSLKNCKDIIGALDLLHPYYAGRPFSELPAIAQEFAGHAQGLAPGTVRNRLAYLRSACRWAWKNHGMGEHDPAERMQLPRVKNARHVYLTREQVLPVFRAMGYGWSRDAARVAFYTGWRIGMVLSSVPLENARGLFLSIPDSKNDEPQIVPVHPKIAHLVRGHWPPQVTTWTASKKVKAALKACGLGHARLHDLRHSAASEMINNDVDLYTVGKVLGHKSAVSTARYAHLAAAKLQGAIGKIGARKSHPKPEAKAA